MQYKNEYKNVFILIFFFFVEIINCSNYSFVEALEKPRALVALEGVFVKLPPTVPVPEPQLAQPHLPAPLLERGTL